MLDYRHANFKTLYFSMVGNDTLTVDTPCDTLRVLLWGKTYIDTDATVANRYVELFVYDELGNAVGHIAVGDVAAANTTITSYIGATVDSNSEIHNEIIIPPCCHLVAAVTGGVAGDAITIRLIVADIPLRAESDKSSSRRRT